MHFPSLRVENKLQSLETQFKDLDSSLQKLAQKFELLEKEMSRDTTQISTLEERWVRVKDRSVLSWFLHVQMTLGRPVQLCAL